MTTLDCRRVDRTDIASILIPDRFENDEDPLVNAQVPGLIYFYFP